ncbi:MAG: hypothetical protein WC538_21125 [Thermoanaerobaculia bacterium]|jgi:hypothetical protein
MDKSVARHRPLCITIFDKNASYGHSNVVPDASARSEAPIAQRYRDPKIRSTDASSASRDELAIPTILVHRSELDGLWSATFADGRRGLTWLGFDVASAEQAEREAVTCWPLVARVRVIDDVILTRPAPPARRGAM